MVVAYLHFFWRLCTFKAGPEKAPRTPGMLVPLLIVYLPVKTLVIYREPAIDFSFLEAIAWAEIPTAIFAAFLFLITASRGVRERFVPVWFCWLGCDLILEVMRITANGLLLPIQSAVIPLQIFQLSLLIWQLVIGGAILNRAVGITRTAGSLAIFLMLVSSLFLTFLIMPTPQINPQINLPN